MGKLWIEIHIENQSDSNFWKDFYKKVGKIDIIVDDGGHTNEQQLSTFINSYRNVNNDGLLVFEDTHASYMRKFGNPSNTHLLISVRIFWTCKIRNLFQKQNNEYIKKIHKIDFFQSIVAFHVSEKKAENSDQ